ncbi:MAG: ribosomal protection-like ABC-F family protein [Brevefilum sp.]
MIQLRLDKVSFSFPSCLIFQNASCEIQAGCYGVIGANGSGKTTLLKLILNDLKPDSGTIIRDKALQIAYMAQEVDLAPDLTAFEAVRQGAQRVLALEAELEVLEEKFSDPGYYKKPKRLEGLLHQQENLLEAYNGLGGPGLAGEIKSLLKSIGFSEEELNLSVRHLSGGQKKLLGLARIIVSRPNILLLDEPDNHLDLEGKARLGTLIEGFSGAVVIVSHDRYFLDMVADEILEVEAGKIIQFHGNYSEYMFEKQIRLEHQAATYQAQRKEITRLEQAAKRLLLWGQVYDNAKFSNHGKNILKRIDRLDKIERPNLNDKPIEINLAGWRGSEKVLEITDLSKGFQTSESKQQTNILQDIHLQLRNGDRVGMIGPNGAGKSLLIRLILGQLEPDSGSIYIGPSIQPGYYAQEFDTLNPQKSLLETICKAGNFSQERGVAFLKKYRFDYNQRDTKVGNLSGGERARLQIAQITLSDANFLLLDEPTNHLDIPSCEVLEDALLDFTGTILAVSHDRYFLDRIANRIIELHGNGTSEHLGNYSDYEQIQLQN